MTGPIFRTYSLVPRGAPGLACDENGLALGPITLAKKVHDGADSRRYRLLAFEDTVKALCLAYGPTSDTFIERRCRGLARVTQLLGSGADALARLYAVLLGFPEITPQGMAKLAVAASLRKYNPDWEDEPRVPAGNSDGGQWASNGGDGEPTAPEGKDQDSRLQLPPGRRIDELGDLLEWIANATPEEESAIRSEIKQLYYDVGDVQGGNALNRALSDVLRDGGDRQTREAVLQDYEPYTRSDPAAAAQFGRDLVTGALLFPSVILPEAPTPATADVWQLGWAARGRQIEQQLGTNLPPNFPVIDRFADGVATSIKSIDLNAGVYQNTSRLETRINAYVDQLAEFDGAKWAGEKVPPRGYNRSNSNVGDSR